MATSRARSAADRAVQYFQTAEIGEARAILDVCKGTLNRRAKTERTPERQHAIQEAGRRPARRSREVGAAEVTAPEGGAPGAPGEGLTTRSDV